MKIKVRKYPTTNGVYYDVVVKTCSAVIEDSLFEEEASDIAKEFFLETALDVKYEDETIPKLIELGIISDEMIKEYMEDKVNTNQQAEVGQKVKVVDCLYGHDHVEDQQSYSLAKTIVDYLNSIGFVIKG